MSREKPESVDERAWWSRYDNEWVFAEKDEDNKLHGLVTYWRPDGTLVNHCHYDHGVPHGSYTRYHESGEVSRKGTFVRGALQGTDVFLRSEHKTTESFPDGLRGEVWRAEMDMMNGSIVAGRLYNKEGQQVGEDGTPCPERPARVPEDAAYSSSSGRWVHGSTDDEYRRDGLWRFYTQEGWVQQEIQYCAGEIQSDTTFANRFASMATMALRAEDWSSCDAAIKAGRSELEDDVDQLELIDIEVRSRFARGEKVEAMKRAQAGLDAHSGSQWWFTSEGQRGRTSAASLQALMARHYLEENRGDDALTLIRSAIGHTPRPRAEFYAIKAHALGLLGREDEQFSSIKNALGIDENLEELATYKDDPKFSEWLASIRPESMTEDGAWEVLGSAGEKLYQYQGAIIDEDDDAAEERETPRRSVYDPEAMEFCLDHPWDISSLPECSPELAAFAEIANTLDICSYRGSLASVCESTLSAAVQTMDGNWLARIQSIFLPGSIVCIDDESLIVASWKGNAHQASATYSIHQDEAEFYHRNESLSAMVVDLLELDEEDQSFSVSEQTRNRWQAASRLTGKHQSFESPFELLELEPRTHWIVNLLIGKNPDIISEIFLGKGIKSAATSEDWDAEREHLAWPHLQAYWLMHHAVFGNPDGLAEVLKHANRSYPAVHELAVFAEKLLAGEEISEVFWNSDRVAEYRLDALDQRPDLLSEAAVAKLKEDNREIFEANEAVQEALESLRSDPENEGLVSFIELLGACAGNHDGYQEALCRQMDKEMDFFMSMKKGRVTPFEELFTRMDVLPERIEQKPSRKEPLETLFEAAVKRSAASPDDHSNTMAGDLYGLGVLSISNASEFDAFFAKVQKMPFYPEKFGRFRRLQVAMLAAPYLAESETAKAFLRGEAARFAEQSEDWKTDTFDFADRLLAEAGDEEQLEALCKRFCEANFSGANWSESIATARRFLEKPSPIMAAGFKAATENGLGRHDDGERAIVVRAYARCAGADARADIVHWLANIEDVRTDCEAAALLAGLIEVDKGTDALAETLERAHDVLTRLDKGSMKVGAALSLLKTIHEHGIPGFAAEAKAMAIAAAEEDYGSDELKAWMIENAGSFQ